MLHCTEVENLGGGPFGGHSSGERASNPKLTLKGDIASITLYSRWLMASPRWICATSRSGTMRRTPGYARSARTRDHFVSRDVNGGRVFEPLWITTRYGNSRFLTYPARSLLLALLMNGLIGPVKRIAGQ